MAQPPNNVNVDVSNKTGFAASHLRVLRVVWLEMLEPTENSFWVWIFLQRKQRGTKMEPVDELILSHALKSNQSIGKPSTPIDK